MRRDLRLADEALPYLCGQHPVREPIETNALDRNWAVQKYVTRPVDLAEGSLSEQGSDLVAAAEGFGDGLEVWC